MESADSQWLEDSGCTVKRCRPLVLTSDVILVNQPLTRCASLETLCSVWGGFIVADFIRCELWRKLKLSQWSVCRLQSSFEWICPVFSGCPLFWVGRLGHEGHSNQSHWIIPSLEFTIKSEDKNQHYECYIYSNIIQDKVKLPFWGTRLIIVKPKEGNWKSTTLSEELQCWILSLQDKNCCQYWKDSWATYLWFLPRCQLKSRFKQINMLHTCGQNLLWCLLAVHVFFRD